MDVEALRTMHIDAIEQEYGKRETILYALGLGYGSDPLDASELPFVYEGGLRSVPSYVNLLCHPGFWAQRPEFGIDWVKILHAEQDFTIHQPLPPTSRMRGEYRVAALEDKGAGRGALLHQEKALYDSASGAHVATVRSTLFLRGNGGEGGFGTPPAAAGLLPDRAPDRSVSIPTLPRQALIYRLSGDWNPLHADPAIAAKAGFAAPILHGLCTNGIACRAVLASYCDNDPARLTGMFTRFSKPVMPGETIRIDFFEEAAGLVMFRAVVEERDEIVLDRCSARYA
ncbi:MaoC family dehydratase N-terminal domain-containing protein [Sphingomonas aliaeris]|uniref:MaoC family dehydratase N-terminal domain-containing protein n=1 Tax=Sphingomonas aliaeris TaxID=2759526 RepID=A0A974S4J7_9SPHN|nr:MaoC/PaaZ C-terminal domain-containing protein [Sphingomonas aliaeris]QQV77668.1 MaoC family dehydratase N-terminal domain-containing protein [Sphingomonas aliaeris]